MAKLDKNQLKILKDILGEQGLLTNKIDTSCYGFDASGLENMPLAVALPQNSHQVSELLKRCNEWRLPVIPRGAGSGTTGAAVPSSNGICLCFSRMNKIIEIDPIDLIAIVEPGVVTGFLQREVEKYGLFYPPDPASLSFCTIGGNVSTCAGGARAIKYGVTKDYVRALEVVLANGQIINTGTLTSKGVVGYDLTRLFVGSEGTLGVITKIVLGLIPKPEAVFTTCAGFLDIDHAVEAITCLFTSGLLPRCAEFLDEKTLRLVRNDFPFEISEDSKAILIIEIDGLKSQMEEETRRIIKCLKKNNASFIFEARDSEKKEKIWQARRNISPSLKRLGFNKKISEDVCVPRRNLSRLLNFIQGLSVKGEIEIFNFGHIGDGNIHVNLLFNNDKANTLKKVEKIIKKIMEKTIELNGTISGEHGIGLTKKSFIALELDKQVLSLHRKIKDIFDPNNILNPGKIF